MIVSSELKRLSKLFPTKLYVVGGAVRDYILGYKTHDYDLGSSLTGEEVVDLLKNTEFKVVPHSLKLGTLGIKVGKETMEYTAFRKDSYTKKGNHSPTKVEFKVDILEDAKRRDFTINAIYYDLQEEKIVDPLMGKLDLEKRIIRTCRAPEKVFEEDALRILRLVRFSAKLGFEVEKETFLEAQNRAETLRQIAPERICEELNKILVSDTENGIEDAHIRGVNMLVEIGAMKEIIPELLEGIGLKQNARYHAYDVFNHVLQTVRRVPARLRMVALLHDVGKPRSIDDEGHMTKHPYVGASMAREILFRLRYPHKEIDRIVRIIENHMFDVKAVAKESDVRIFILKNHDILDDLIELKKADFIAHGKEEGESPSALRLMSVKNKMVEQGVAFSLKELPIGGNDLVELKVKPSLRAKLLNSLLEHGAILGRALTREECVRFLETH